MQDKNLFLLHQPEEIRKLKNELESTRELLDEKINQIAKLDTEKGEEPRCTELDEACRKTQTIPAAEQSNENETRIKVVGDKYEEIKSAMNQSSDIFYIVLDKGNQSFVRAEPDLNDPI